MKWQPLSHTQPLVLYNTEFSDSPKEICNKRKIHLRIWFICDVVLHKTKEKNSQVDQYGQ